MLYIYNVGQYIGQYNLVMTAVQWFTAFQELYSKRSGNDDSVLIQNI